MYSSVDFKKNRENVSRETIRKTGAKAASSSNKSIGK